MPYPNPDGTTDTDLYLQADKFRAAFAADLPVSTTRLMQATQRLQAGVTQAQLDTMLVDNPRRYFSPAKP
ncbi:phosphotriesterase family protein [Streptomyces mirabilis]|uniref:phosphotriesterase family protein n=1 Tax=Streptomyces mirabilis TaxID=68239 RepID=UPI0036941AE0